MADRNVASLYDSLCAFESATRRSDAYPIHKKLKFDGTSQSDIYEWIVANIGLPSGGRILDAGCGVGFGALLMARCCSSHIDAFSLSRLEIERARRASVGQGFSGRVTFRCRSFDDLRPETYDMIAAVESLKHSHDLRHSLEVMVRALRVGGRLVIAEDLFLGADSWRSHRLMDDWALSALYREADYLAVLGAGSCRVFDLSSRVRRASQFGLLVRRAFLGPAIALSGRRASALRTFGGGLDLESLYTKRQMAYKVIVFERTDGVAR